MIANIPTSMIIWAVFIGFSALKKNGRTNASGNRRIIEGWMELNLNNILYVHRKFKKKTNTDY